MSSSVAANESLGGCEYTLYEDLKPISLPPEDVASHSECLKQRLENLDDWKEQFNALTEIQRIAKHQPAYLNLSIRGQSCPLEVWYGPILACVNSLRSTLSKNALYTLSALTVSPARVHLSSLLVRSSRPSPLQSPLGSPSRNKQSRQPTARLTATFGCFLSKSSSPSEGKFIQNLAEQVACEISRLPKILDALLPMLLKLAKDNCKNGRYQAKMAAVLNAAWDAEAGRRFECAVGIAEDEFETIAIGMAQIAAELIGDKLTETRTLAKGLLKKLSDFAEKYDGRKNGKHIALESKGLATVLKRVLDSLLESMQSTAMRNAFLKALPYCESHSCSAQQRNRPSSTMSQQLGPLRTRMASDLSRSAKTSDCHDHSIRDQLDKGDKCSQITVSAPLIERGRDKTVFEQRKESERSRSPSIECLGSQMAPPTESIWSEESAPTKQCDYSVADEGTAQNLSCPRAVPPNFLSGPLGHQRVPSLQAIHRPPAAARAPSLPRQQQLTRPRSCRTSVDSVVHPPSIAENQYRHSYDEGESTYYRPESVAGTSHDSSTRSARIYRQIVSPAGSVNRPESSFPKAPTYTRFPLGRPKPAQRLERDRSRGVAASDSIVESFGSQPGPIRQESRHVRNGSLSRTLPTHQRIDSRTRKQSFPSGTHENVAPQNRPGCTSQIKQPYSDCIPGIVGHVRKDSGRVVGEGARFRDRSLTGAMRRVQTGPYEDPQRPRFEDNTNPRQGSFASSVVERTSLGGIRGIIPKAPATTGMLATQPVGAKSIGTPEVPVGAHNSADWARSADWRRTSGSEEREEAGGDLRRRVSADRPFVPMRKNSLADRPPRWPGESGRRAGKAPVPPLAIPPSPKARRGRMNMEHSLGTLSTATGESLRGGVVVPPHRSRSLTGNRSLQATQPDDGALRDFQDKFGFLGDASTTSDADG